VRHNLRLAAALLVSSLATPGELRAANHREAPITALDHKADITDVYAFVSYTPGQGPGVAPAKVTLIMNVDPLIDPSNGPTVFPFDPNILYAIKVDNDHDAMEDVTFEFRFSTEYQLPGVYTALAGIGPNGASDPNTGELRVPPRILGFDNPGLNQRQSYGVTLVRRGRSPGRVVLGNSSGAPFFAVPNNAGPRTMDYAALYQAGTYTSLTTNTPKLSVAGVSVFAGTVDDPFWIDLGGTFDTANFRTGGSGVPGVLTGSEDAATSNFAADFVSGFGVNSIAVEVPIELLTATGTILPASDPLATIGVWATTSRRAQSIRRANIVVPATGTRALPTSLEVGAWRQVQRMGNPLVNELLVGIRFKDKFSIRPPRFDADYADPFFLNPPIVKIVEALYGGALSVPPAPRTDLLPLVQYGSGAPGPIADLLRLNTGVSATDPNDPAFSRLGGAAGDPAGFPNGRRLQDDVTDIALRVVVGGVLNPTFPGYTTGVNDRLGDGVNVNDVAYQPAFPYLGFAPEGSNRKHCDPGEPGCGSTVGQ
jgi:hypothetical protein